VSAAVERTECASCGATDVEDPDPRALDAAGWARVAEQHDAGCEWIATRAHPRDPRDLVIRAARAAAATFVEEFPGEAPTGDWDREAWGLDTDTGALRFLTAEQAEALWPVYADALAAEVARLARIAP
jgi:hypothetical protein